MRAPRVLLLSCILSQVALAGSGGWIEYADETANRLVASPDRGISDNAEKDYAWGDVDQDGDIDIVCVRKTESSRACSVNPSHCPNVLFMQEGVKEGHAMDGVFVDRTLEYATEADDGGQGFFDVTNDRDVILVDVDGDGWLDIVTAPTISDGLPKTISHPRIYMNKGEIGGVWQGFRYEEARIPQIRTIGSNLAVAPRFCAVAAGDITRDGDDRPDLYFGDYDNGATAPPMPNGHDVNDRLLVNDGNGFFTDSLQTRMSSQMLLSAFAMAVAVEDMNNDGTLDVVKDTALQTPQRVSISYNDPDNEGFFDVFDVAVGAAPYHITVGHINQDNWLDIAVTDDATDFYMLNQGNGGSGPVNFTNTNFSGDDGFGGNSVIADLNNDGHNDVVITDHDVDFTGCGRRMHIYRNLGNEPLVTLQEQGGAAPWTPKGSHDVAIFDINGDNWLDMFIGTCGTGGEKGTEIWINQPPFGMVFSYPNGLPAFVTPDVPFTFEVQVAGVSGGIPADDTGVLHLSVNEGPFTQIPMQFLGSDTYEAEFPPSNCADRLNFYVTAELQGGGLFTDPPGAPGSSYEAVVAIGLETVLRDEIEGDVSGWTIVSDPSLDTGEWEQADPIGTFVGGGDLIAPEDDATAGAENVMAFVTENGLPGGQAGTADVDGGPTYLISPALDLDGTDGTITYARWFHDSGNVDELTTQISNSGVNGPWTLVHSTGGTSSEWETVSFLVSDYVTPTATIHVRFGTEDTAGSPSLVEAGIDNLQLDTIICAVCNNNEECDDGNPCTENTCNAGACVVTNARGPCDDGDPCTDNDECMGGVCMGTNIPGCIVCASAGECDDTNGCTDDDCVGNVCQNTPNNDVCDDGNMCTENDACDGGSCSGDLIPGCAACDFNEDCDDGVFCNGEETCNGLTCDPGTNPCGNDTCDEVNDVCAVALQARMGDPVRGLDASELARFDEGKLAFELGLTVGQGLGPLFNQNSCASCHSAGGAGGSGNIFVTRFGASDKQGFDPLEALGGSLLQANATDDDCLETVPPEATITATRMTPSIFGGGLVEAIPDGDLITNADNQAASVSGTVHMVTPLEDQGAQLVGRFGWKAQVATLLTFSADAALNEMGLTNRFLTEENAPNGDEGLLAQCDTVADPEDNTALGNGAEFIDRTTDFQRFLAQPPQTPRSGMTGEALFVSVGCADCHVPAWTTGTAPEDALSNKIIKPYSDFLLHDMGQFGDGIVQGASGPTEMRTPALWGLRVRSPLMHDGSADDGDFATRIGQAIAAHNVVGSEAQDSVLNYQLLLQSERDAIIAFLDSLGRAEFDHDGDNAVTDADFGQFALCYTGPGSFYTADDTCAISDVDQDSDVDDDDYALFIQAYDGELPDCNGNAVVDFRDILDGTSPDGDANGVLDQCTPPGVAVEGPRSLAVTPAGGPENVAIRLTSPDPISPCFEMYADADGDLVAAPVYQSPAAWQTVALRGAGLVPDTTYTIQTEFESGALTDERTRHTNFWGDVNGSGVANLGDVQDIVLAFQGNFVNVSLAAADIWPCTPNNVVNLDDAFRGVQAFQGQSFEDAGCSPACP